MNKLCFIVLTLLALSCVRRKEINLNLTDKPTYIVECYAEKDSLIHLSLSRTIPYSNFSPANVIASLVPDAFVTVSYNDKIDTLNYFTPGSKNSHFKLGEYRSNDIISKQINTPLILKILTPDSLTIDGMSEFLQPIQIDTILWYFVDTSVSITVKWTDPAPNDNNYLRFLFFKNKKKTVSSESIFDDRILNNENGEFSTRFRFEKGDTVHVHLEHIPKPMYDFIRTYRRANRASSNFLTEPSVILSNISNAKGIFTTISRTKKTIILN